MEILLIFNEYNTITKFNENDSAKATSKDYVRKVLEKQGLNYYDTINETFNSHPIVKKVMATFNEIDSPTSNNNQDD